MRRKTRKYAKCPCGKRFKKNIKWHEYCSEECKHKFWILRKAEEYKNAEKGQK